MEWTFVGDKTLKGKEAVRQWMATTYVEPPKFMVANFIAEDDFVTALGDITMKDEDGKAAYYSYCDVWRFRGGKFYKMVGDAHPTSQTKMSWLIVNRFNHISSRTL